MAVLKLIHAVFPPVKTMFSKRKDVKNFKPTIETSIDSFVTTLATDAQVKPYLLKREEDMKKFGRSVQPQIFKIMDATPEQGKYIIEADEISWRFNHIVEALDIIIEIFFLFNVEYPFESQRFYTFIARFFYGIGTTQDTKMLTIINNLNFEK